jgi:isoquinoline 1-oxidoreductase beta subunit
MAFRIDLVRREHEPSAKVLEAVAELSGWTGSTPDGIGRGVAFSHTFGTPVAQVVEVAQTDAGIRLNKVWIACDPGVALDPGTIEAQLTGGCIFGLSAAIMGEITFAEGQVEQGNFPNYDFLRMNNAPAFEVAILQNAPFVGGIGEPGTPPAAPALGNALFDLTGQRLRATPFFKQLDFVI